MCGMNLWSERTPVDAPPSHFRGEPAPAPGTPIIRNISHLAPATYQRPNFALPKLRQFHSAQLHIRPPPRKLYLETTVQE